MKYRFLITVIVFCLLPICLLAQQKIILTGDSDGLGYEVFLTIELIYKNKSNDTQISIPLRDLPNGILPVENPEYAVLRYTFQIPKNHTFFTPSRNRENLRVQFTSDGSFSFNETKTIKLRKEEYKGFIEIPIPRRGRGSITVNVRDVDGKVFEANTTIIPHTVYSISDAASVIRLSDESVVNQQYFVTEHIKALDAFKHFRGNRFSGLDAYSGIHIALKNIENSLTGLYDELNAGTNSSQVVDFYKVFGQRKLSQHSMTRSWYDNAVRKIQEADRNFAKSTPGNIDLAGAKNRLDEYQVIFCNIPGYQCFNLSYFEELKKLLATDNTCATITSSYRNVSNINTLSALYRQCREKECNENICLQIKERIYQVECENQLEQAKSELSIREKRSQLKIIINDTNCSAVAAEARSILNEIPIPEFPENQDFPAVIAENPETGGKLLSFTITFISGKDLELKTIDTVAVDAFPDYHSHQWTEKDKSVTIILEDRQKPYEVVFESTVTGEPISTVLTKEKFSATVEGIDGANRFITLNNGTPPYFARFSDIEGKQSFTIRLNVPVDTLFLDELGKHYQGQYELTILDNNGRSGLVEAHVLSLSNDNWPLWLKLLIPLVLLIGFLIYRNLPLTNQE